MAVWNGVIDKNTGDLIRAGFCDFSSDGSLDPVNEEVITSIPFPAKVRNSKAENSMHRYDSNTQQWSEVAIKKVLEAEYTIQNRDATGRLNKTQRYANLDVESNPTDLVEEIEYIYQGLKLMGETHTTYFNDGSIKNVVEYEWVTNGNGNPLRKKV